MLNQHAIHLIANYFKDKPVIRAYLFGSHVRDQENDNSDIDILVELDYSQHIGLKYITMQNDLQRILKSKVDLLSNNAVSRYIRPIIDREKQLIYAR